MPETVVHARRQQVKAGGVGHVFPHRRGISGDMERRTMRKREKPTTPAEESSVRRPSLHPFYRNKFKTGLGLCPVAEAAYEGILSLPLYPSMSDGDVIHVIETIKKVVVPGTQISP